MRDPHIDKLIRDLKEKKWREGEGKKLTDSFGENLKGQFGPVLEGMGKELKTSIEASLKGLKMPDMPKMPEYKQHEIPQPIVNVDAPVVNVPAPVVNVPAPIVNVPQTKFPEFPEFPTEIGIREGKLPIKVVVADQTGKPFNWGSLQPGASGGRGDFFTISDIRTSAGASVIDQVEGAVKVTGSFSVTASNNSTQLIDSSLNAFGTAANPINVAITSGAASSTKAQIGNSDGDFSQANPLPVVFSSSGSTASALIDSSGVQYSGSNPLPVTFSAAASQNVNLFDAQQSTITSHAGLEDFRGIDTSLIRVVNVESALNSSTATLGIGGEFTGGVELVRDYASILIYVFSDVASSTNGLVVQQSKDGTNFDVTDSFTIPAGSGKTFSFQPASNYYRLFYANGATGQAAFRLSTIHHYLPVKASSQKSSDSYTNETDLEQVWSFNSMYDAAGDTWSRMRSGDGVATGALRVTQANDVVSSVNIVSTITQTVQQVSGAADSVIVISPIAQGDEASSIRVVHAGNAATSVATQATGLNETTSGVLRTVSMTDSIDSTNVMQWGGTGVATGLNENGTGVVKVAMITSVVESTNIVTFNGNAPATGLNETTSGVLRVAQMTDVTSSIFVTGAAESFFAYEVMTTNKTAKSDGADIRPKADDLGRIVMRPIQVRDLISTAYLAQSTGTETTLLAATAGAFNDLIMITATNNSTAAIQADIRAVTGGNIIHTMYIPASTGPVGWSPSVPWPQDATGNNWTVDLPDVTGTTVYFSALFSREV